MKNLSFYIFLVLFFCNIGWTETSLPECKGSNYEKWTNCKGTETWENGRKYVGEFKDGKRYGQGIMTHPDGSKYTGQWEDSIPNGEGTYTFADGKIDKGIWKKSVLIKRKK